MSGSDVFSGFYRLSRQQRLQKLYDLGLLDRDDLQCLNEASPARYRDQAEKFIENVIGCFPMPMGVVPGCVIDGQAVTVPMVVEETSIVAALNRVAKWVRQDGVLTTSQQGDCVLGQMQLGNIHNFDEVANQLTAHAQSWLALINTTVLASLVKRGGGAKRLELRRVPDPNQANDLAVIHLHCNVCDAMGANLINMALEALRPEVARAIGVSVQTCIVSNLSDSQITRAKLVLRQVPRETRRAIIATARFAELDPYRAATHNKGVMNAIDPILIATGNDWRAVEAGVHAYASRNGHYSAITRWYEAEDDALIGEIEAPIAVGVVGGVTKTHPFAQMALKLLKVQRASELSKICAAVGLMQNYAALHALATDGIVAGHMRLHIDNLVEAVGACSEEYPAVRMALQRILENTRKVTLSDAHAALSQVRALNQLQGA